MDLDALSSHRRTSHFSAGFFTPRAEISEELRLTNRIDFSMNFSAALCRVSRSDHNFDVHFEQIRNWIDLAE